MFGLIFAGLLAVSTPVDTAPVEEETELEVSCPLDDDTLIETRIPLDRLPVAAIFEMTYTLDGVEVGRVTTDERILIPGIEIAISVDLPEGIGNFDTCSIELLSGIVAEDFQPVEQDVKLAMMACSDQLSDDFHDALFGTPGDDDARCDLLSNYLSLESNPLALTVNLELRRLQLQISVLVLGSLGPEGDADLVADLDDFQAMLEFWATL